MIKTVPHEDSVRAELSVLLSVLMEFSPIYRDWETEVVSNINIQYHTQIARDRALQYSTCIQQWIEKEREKDEWSKKSKKSESKAGAL